MKTRIIKNTELKNEPSAHKRTMSSVDIAEMTGKRHSDVMRSIRGNGADMDKKLANANLRRPHTKMNKVSQDPCIY